MPLRQAAAIPNVALLSLQKLEVDIASIIDMADVIGCAAQRMLPLELASKLLAAVIRRFHEGLLRIGCAAQKGSRLSWLRASASRI